LIYHRRHLLNIIKNYISGWVSQYLPKSPELPLSARTCTVYISPEAREVIRHARDSLTFAANVAVTAADAVPDDQESDNDVEEMSVRANRPGSPRGSRGGSPRDSPRSLAGSPGAHGVNLDELADPPVCPVPVRRRQMYHYGVTDDDDDRIGALNNATARVMVRPNRLFYMTSSTHPAF